MAKINDDIVMLPIDSITPYEGSHKTSGSIDLLVESIQKYGITQPISVDKNYVIVTGNGVYKAARQLGYSELPCIVLDYLTDDEIRKYRIADNKTGEFARWNETKLKKELSYMSSPTDMQFAFDESIFSLLGQEVSPKKQDNVPVFDPTGVGAKDIPEEYSNDDSEEKPYDFDKAMKEVESFRSSLNNVESSMSPKPVQYVEYVCSKCGKTVRFRI